MTSHVAEVQCARCGSWHPVEDTCTSLRCDPKFVRLTDCPHCLGTGYIVISEAVYPPHWDAHPEEAEPCFDCDAAVQKGWIPPEARIPVDPFTPVAPLAAGDPALAASGPTVGGRSSGEGRTVTGTNGGGQ